jgi:hypothetical protein
VEQRLVLSAVRRGSRLRTPDSSTPILHSKFNFSAVFAGQAVGIKEVQDDSWLVSFMDFDLGYFDLETRVLEPFEKAWNCSEVTVRMNFRMNSSALTRTSSIDQPTFFGERTVLCEHEEYLLDAGNGQFQIVGSARGEGGNCR